MGQKYRLACLALGGSVMLPFFALIGLRLIAFSDWDEECIETESVLPFLLEPRLDK